MVILHTTPNPHCGSMRSQKQNNIYRFSDIMHNDIMYNDIIYNDIMHNGIPLMNVITAQV